MFEVIFPTIKKDVIVNGVLLDYFLEEVDISIISDDKTVPKRYEQIKRTLTEVIYERNDGIHSKTKCKEWADVVMVNDDDMLQALKEVLVLADGKNEYSIKELLMPKTPVPMLEMGKLENKEG